MGERTSQRRSDRYRGKFIMTVVVDALPMTLFHRLSSVEGDREMIELKSRHKSGKERGP
jgi:hypothetical protein